MSTTSTYVVLVTFKAFYTFRSEQRLGAGCIAKHNFLLPAQPVKVNVLITSRRTGGSYNWIIHFGLPATTHNCSRRAS